HVADSGSRGPRGDRVSQPAGGKAAAERRGVEHVVLEVAPGPFGTWPDAAEGSRRNRGRVLVDRHERLGGHAMTGAELLVHCLEREGVRYVFGVPGEETLDVNEAGAVVAEAVRKAFKRAQEEKPGACHLELPEDVAQGAAEGEPLLADRPRRPSPDRPSLARAADIINRAARPLILAGNGVIRGRASRELTALAERAQMPVVTTFMAKGAISANHPLARTTVGLASDEPARVGFTSADTVIAVGYD